MTLSAGLHHITALSGDIRRTHDFYARVLGLRLVKRTVNHDDPASWHLYYGDALGAPGTIVSFLSWEDTRQAQPGAGEAVTMSFAIPPGAAAFWAERLADEGVAFALDHGATAPVIALHDPDGVGLELVEEPVRADANPPASEAPFDMAITGLSGATLLVDDLEATARVLMDVFGWVENGRAELPGFERLRFIRPGGAAPGGRIELLRGQSIPPAKRGAGSIHHVAFRASDEAQQSEMVAMLRKAGIETTPQLDRTYYQAVYFREPSGVLFAIATDGPGFAVDEDVETMGAKLMLPERLKADRAKILAKLPEF